MKKRWICIIVENNIGVLAKITGLFSAKLYNVLSLSVSKTQDKEISCITICVYSDEQMFEQIKKQLNRCIEVIKVIDYTNKDICIKELMIVTLHNCNQNTVETIRNYIKDVDGCILQNHGMALILEIVQTEEQNDNFINELTCIFKGNLTYLRNASIAFELESL